MSQTFRASWCFLYDPQLKRQSATEKCQYRHDKKSHDKISQNAIVLVFKWNCSHRIHPRKPNSEQNPLQGYPWSFKRSIRRKHPELWRRKNWLPLHDNTHSHRSVLVQEELSRQQVTVLQHPPYIPDVAPCDFCLFHRTKALLLGRKFHSAEEVIAATGEAVHNLPANMFQRCFQQLYQRW